MTLGPVVSSAGLAEDEVIWSEDLAEWSRADRVHCSGLQIDEDGSWNVLAAGSLIVVHIDALELEVRIAVVASCWVNSVLVGNHFPELKYEDNLTVA